MDESNRHSDLIIGLLGEHMLRDPERFTQDERVSWWAAIQAAERQTSIERRQVGLEAQNVASRVSRAMLAARLGQALPLGELLTRVADVRGRPSAVTRIAYEARTAPLVETAVAAGQGTDLLEEVVDTWVELPAGTPKGDYVALPVIGDSMEPLLLARDVVLVKLGSDVARDTVVVARKNDGYVVKYVSELTDREIELGSLGASYPTVRIPRVDHRIVGTVIARLRRF